MEKRRDVKPLTRRSAGPILGAALKTKPRALLLFPPIYDFAALDRGGFVGATTSLIYQVSPPGKGKNDKRTDKT